MSELKCTYRHYPWKLKQFHKKPSWTLYVWSERLKTNVVTVDVETEQDIHWLIAELKNLKPSKLKDFE